MFCFSFLLSSFFSLHPNELFVIVWFYFNPIKFSVDLKDIHISFCGLWVSNIGSNRFSNRHIFECVCIYYYILLWWCFFSLCFFFLLVYANFGITNIVLTLSLFLLKFIDYTFIIIINSINHSTKLIINCIWLWCIGLDWCIGCNVTIDDFCVQIIYCKRLLINCLFV